jgi:hypothetical protein
MLGRIYRLSELRNLSNWRWEYGTDGRHRSVRPKTISEFSDRIRLAWLVFTQKADAFVWYDEDYERLR